MHIEMTNQRWALGAILILAIAGLIYASWPKPGKPVDVQKIINDTKAEMTKMYEEQLKEKQVAIDDYVSRLKVSEAKTKVWQKKYDDLQKEKINVKPPTTDKELRDRFTALGFAPAPAGKCGPGYICFSTGYSK